MVSTLPSPRPGNEVAPRGVMSTSWEQALRPVVETALAQIRCEFVLEVVRFYGIVDVNK